MSKSARDKAAEVCEYLNLPSGKNGRSFKLIYDMLIEYGQDTRHACAEAVKGIPDHQICHATIDRACMNAKVE